MKTRPAATVGWPNIMIAPGTPKAHLSSSRGRSAAVRPGLGWNRQFSTLRAPAVERGPVERKRRRGGGALARHRRLGADLAAGQILGQRDPLLGVSTEPCAFIMPLAERIDDEVWRHRAQGRTRLGARVAELSWQTAQSPLEQRRMRAFVRRLRMRRAQPRREADDRRRGEQKRTASQVLGPIACRRKA